MFQNAAFETKVDNPSLDRNQNNERFQPTKEGPTLKPNSLKSSTCEHITHLPCVTKLHF